MKKIIPTLIIIALGGWGIYYFVYKQPASGPAGDTVATSTAQVYSNTTYGISFSYPFGYVLTEGEKGNVERRHYSIVLVRAEDGIPPVNGEGPTAISFDIYQNNIDKQSLVNWINNASVSNFKLSDGTYASTTVDGVPAITYTWSGLYEGRTTALINADSIVAVSVTYLTPQDENLHVYQSVLQSLKLGSASSTPLSGVY